MRRLVLLTAMLLAVLAGDLFFAQPALAEGGSSNIVVQTIPGPTVAQKFTERAKSSWPWYLVRGSGMVAAAALVILLLSGIGQVTGYTFRFLEPLTAWASHRALGITFGVAALVHIFSLLFDHFVAFNIWQLLVPWLSTHKPVTIFGVHLGSLYVALGVLSFYLAALTIIVSLLWIEKKPRLWKITHLIAYVIIAFVFVHALFLGTDLAHGFWRWLWIVSGAGVAIAILHRLWRARTV